MNPDTEKRAQESDHDLLIRIDTKLGLFIAQTNTATDNIVSLKETKADKETIAKIQTDQEQRIRRLERYGAITIGGLVVLQLVISVAT